MQTEPVSTVQRLQLETLLAEIRRYLEAVDLFRGEGHEPSWTSDLVPDQARQ